MAIDRRDIIGGPSLLHIMFALCDPDNEKAHPVARRSIRFRTRYTRSDRYVVESDIEATIVSAKSPTQGSVWVLGGLYLAEGEVLWGEFRARYDVVTRKGIIDLNTDGEIRITLRKLGGEFEATCEAFPDIREFGTDPNQAIGRWIRETERFWDLPISISFDGNHRETARYLAEQALG